MTLPTSGQQPSQGQDLASHEDAVLPLDDGGLYVCQDGPRTAPALLLLHGSAAAVGSWRALVPLLTAAHHVIRIDLRGHGRSAPPAGGDYTVPGQARTVAAALERLGVDRLVAVGHSSGGYAATALAELRPDLVTGLVLIDTGPSLDAFDGPDSAAIGPEQWPPSDAMLRMFASTGFREGFEIPQDLVDDARTMTYEAFVGTQEAARAYLAERTLPDRLAVLGKPLQVVFGDQDRRWRPSSAADYRKVPGARVAWLPGSGHTPILEDPAGTAALLLAFTASHA
ncbi:alpha/beta fold hydrolase [Streptomyces sp. NPDC057694]|uniref:alpha/beta fold hydrolase n=1 Tax=Streptomyces sp. NPDC057694 TaxID=3346216 RepID=UPI003681BA8A